MPSVLLLHTNREYATSLAEAVGSLDAGYEVTVVSRRPIRDRLEHLLDREYDLVQVDELLVNGVFACGASVFPGTPFVASIRGWADYTNAHGQYGRVRDASIRLRSEAVLRRADSVIFLSERTRREFTRRYRVDDATVVGRPIDVEHYRSEIGRGSDPSSDDETFDLLTVTNLRYEEKFEGVTTVLRGLRPLFERHDELRYAIAGDGTYRRALERFLDEYPYADRVSVLGYRDDVPALLAGADAFVYVSYLDAYPTVVLEAQAAGLPVIGGDAVGVPAALGEAGVLCPPTPDGVGDAVERVLVDDEFRAALAKESEEKMAAYNERCARRHVAIWDDVLDRSR